VFKEVGSLSNLLTIKKMTIGVPGVPGDDDDTDLLGEEDQRPEIMLDETELARLAQLPLGRTIRIQLDGDQCLYSKLLLEDTAEKQEIAFSLTEDRMSTTCWVIITDKVENKIKIKVTEHGPIDLKKFLNGYVL